MSIQRPTAVLGIVPGFSMLILAIGLMNHVMVIPPLLRDAERDAWVSILVTVLPYLLWISILYYILKYTHQQPVLSLIRSRFGTWAGGVIRALFAVYLFVMSLITVKETVMWAHASYFPRTPFVVLSVALILLCCFAAWSGIRAIAIASGVLLPFVILFGDFVMTSNLPKKEYALLLPMFEHGFGRVLQGAVYIGGGLAELVILLLFQHQFKKKIPLWTLWVLGIFLILLIMGPVTGAIAEFGPYEAANLRYPAYEEWRLVRIGKYLQHVDFLSIYQWLAGAFSRISLSLFLLLDLTVTERKRKARGIGVAVFGAVFVLLVSLPISDMQFLFFLKHVYFPFSLLFATGLLLLILTMIILEKRTKGVMP